MAYVKLFKVLVDSPLGYQSVNQAADNFADIRTQLSVEHGTNEYGASFGLWGVLNGAGFGLKYDLIGRHNLPEIPRSVGYAATYLAAFVVNAFRWAGPGIPYVIRNSAGNYTVPVVGLSSFWAKVSQVGSASVTNLEPQVRPFYPAATNRFTVGLNIITYQLSGAALVATDMDFSIALYGTP